jgi:hypothetical protein
VTESFEAGGSQFLSIPNETPPPSSTFQFAEAASSLLMGKMPYNSSAVLWAMNAVFASNSSGVLLNNPYDGDWANTETIPAYMLATWLFQSEMKNATGYWIVSLHNVNITSISYSDGTLKVSVASGINRSETFSIGNSPVSGGFLLEGAALIVAAAVAVGVFALYRREEIIRKR